MVAVGDEVVKVMEDGLLRSDHSSAGRAEDCRVAQLSLGRWFDSA